MKRGFTILELLVASLLLGMLMTILTTIFNQSSIAWRTGVAGVADLDEVRTNMAKVREEADNVYVWYDGDKIHRVLGLWDRNGKLRKRAVDADDANALTEEKAKYMKEKASSIGTPDQALNQFSPAAQINVGNVKNGGGLSTYSVNVMCLGPDKKFDTWDDIWSYPDDFE